jgi:hypothetical protein
MRICVIIVGIFDYDENILKEIIRCFSLDNMNVDIFIYNNNTLENNDKIINFFNNNKINTVIVKSIQYSSNSINDDSNLIIRKLDITDKIKNNWENFKNNCVNNNIINNNTLSEHVPFKDLNFFDPKIFSSPQFEQIYLALNEIIKYENNNNFNYDYIMKIRLDFFLKHDKFGPIHYFNDTNDILLKSYNNLKYYYDKIDEDDDYHLTEFRINNYLYWRTTKYLGGQFILNKISYDKIENSLDNRDNFNNIIKDKFIITVNDACFFSSGINFKLFMNNLYNNYGEYYNNECKFWWTAESQFLQSILDSGLYYLDYLQNNNYYRGREMWVNDYHGIEKYDKNNMNTTN